MTVPPCDHCGQPWAHSFGRPAAKQNLRKVIVLAVLGGLGAQLPLLVFAAFIYAGLTRPDMVTIGRIISMPPAGPLVPMSQACRLFDRWQRNPRNPSLLDQALADAYSPRVPEKFSSRLRGELDGLRNWNRVATSLHSP